ncbi:MAG: sigma-70 family RNA polymerase sigma factor [Prevotella sp.]|nr:sigma-70 family RNA polymerase sigma factor [Prevotella sp.]
MDKDKKSLNAYLHEIGREKLLSDEEERQLADRIQGGDSRAIDRLTSANLTYVVSLAHQYEGRGLAVEDLVSEGNIGMLRAATKFSSAQDKRFVTFAAPYIREAMEQAIEQQAGLYRVPRNVSDTKLEKKRSHALSIDAPVGGSHELSLGHVIPDQNATVPGDKLENEALLFELRSLVDALEERDRQVVRSLYGLDGEPKTMMQVALIMGLKRERVRQIRDKAIRAICRMTKNSELRDYLRS